MCNMTEYAALMHNTGKAFEIEVLVWASQWPSLTAALQNCHWGDCTEDDASSCPTLDWCPFNWYRTSGDSNNRLGNRNNRKTIRARPRRK